MRHVPNILSALRLLAAPFAAWLIVGGHDIASLMVFAAAALSDALDGTIARRFGHTSRFGAWLDPAADKLLMVSCVLALFAVAAAPLWLAVLVVARDLLIAAGWVGAWALSLAVPLAPLRIGKASTLAQICYIGLMLLMLAFDIVAPRLSAAAAFATGLLTVLSGGAYAGLFLRSLLSGGRGA
jgi:cardiolipin synthase